MMPRTIDSKNRIIYIDNQTLEALRRCEIYTSYWLRGLRKTPKTSALYFGTICHSALHILYGFYQEDGLFSEVWNLPEALEHCQDYDPAYSDERGRTKERLMSVLVDYSRFIDTEHDYKEFALENPTLLAEEFISTTIGSWNQDTETLYNKDFTFDEEDRGDLWEVRYSGILSRVLCSQDQTMITIMDHKTTSFNAITAEVYELTPQFTGYVWLLRNGFPTLTKGKTITFLIDLIKLQSKKENKFYRKTLPWSGENPIKYWDWRCAEWEARRLKEIETLLRLKPPFIDRPRCSDYFTPCDYYDLCRSNPLDREGIETFYMTDIWDIHGLCPTE